MIGAVVLAGGQGRRAGGAKIVWKFDGIPAVRRVAEVALAARNISRVAVVSGAWPAEVKAAVSGLPVVLAHNPGYASGQAGSLKTGLLALGGDLRAAIFLLADQPFITAGIIDALADFYLKTGVAIVAPMIGGRRANPVLFDLARFRENLLNLDGDEGGRSLMAAYPAELALLDMNGFAPIHFQDFDTKEQYNKLL